MAEAFASIPLPDISSAKDDIKIAESSVPVTTPSGKVNVFYREVLPKNAPSGRPPILLLHGMAFKSSTWQELGTLHVLGALGYRAVAMDLPGYGNTRGNAMEGQAAAAFLDAFMTATKISKPVIVSPSMSGYYSLPYVLSEKSNEVTGYVPVAPVSTERFSQEAYGKVHVPVMIVYGENDTRLGEISLKNLSGFPNKDIVCFPDAGHACYMNKPDLWHKCIYNFLQKYF